jgi:hypothetical protein
MRFILAQVNSRLMDKALRLVFPGAKARKTGPNKTAMARDLDW